MERPNKPVERKIRTYFCQHCRWAASASAPVAVWWSISSPDGWLCGARPVMFVQRASRLVLALIFGLTAAPALSEGKRFVDWATVSHPLHGFQIAYPGNVFSPSGGPVNQDGQVFISRDGTAKLIVGAFANDSEATLLDYRSQLLTDNYPGADIDFGPIRRNWFVISGTRGTMHFYERVSFTCGGRLINSWALLYPVSLRAFYDRVVEAIAQTYTPGAGHNGHCDELQIVR